jgi:hypothetical protein
MKKLNIGRRVGDIKEVFDFIKCSNDKNKLIELVESREYYRHMEEDAFETVVNYANAEELKIAKEKYGEGGKVNMCTAIQELMADSRNEGIERGIDRSINALIETCQEFDESYEDTVSRIKCKFDISAEEAENYVSKCWNK